MKVFAAAVLAVLAGSQAVAADAVPIDPKAVYFKSIAYAGTGCPVSPPSAQVRLSDDRTTFSILFDQFVAEAGPGIPRASNRRNCQLNIGVHIPGGFQYSIASADYRGWAQLDAKVKGIQTASYYFQGDGRTVTTKAEIPGAYVNDYQIHDEIEFTTLSWSPCGEDSNININTSIFVDNSKNKAASGSLTTDSIDGKVTQKYAFVWRPCTRRATA
ncbi:uncharacterized protein EV422DRAFT_73187 [Fimicolochytrium jonesii]|uniref:uncharacterized protein n=1 Tax=Fimicolochytrium jonesii TaxID=1396493 RepID=UPI0022FE6A2B|nr:uncharacterized protein EV422DRAFT_73187 [Fimicolochytrium jonesii]KAI8820493.1 hypothetical protein EV422DRAFT_73187 [Fimicolochytrium jonesii]